ncbi:hypothetical protein CH63R_05060 [Colletotrichum higginsianum IMI 349063]|uniref:Uncharacterized protein n=1 Tax=Colletotrichum higginsianum (strain IMI 349063) TaxID=759273 RepID=A0A1B7YLD6_COLHI|nr:hypothetical protein CH63R_05060 [Colletotrichum higginsianum IMI 349063]OBR12764.1 hypothetical protein CH63R_05060 [Colletotrichum higginsianum IMI 349063]GJC94436.1 hypothetical protein ColKHC_03262 [Colletotrichum higginsianum]
MTTVATKRITHAAASVKAQAPYFVDNKYLFLTLVDDVYGAVHMLPTSGVSFLMFSKYANTQPTAATVKMKDSAENTMPAKEAIRLGLTKATAVAMMASPAVEAATAGRTKPKVKSRSLFLDMDEGKVSTIDLTEKDGS